jgi:hypothetical protein
MCAGGVILSRKRPPLLLGESTAAMVRKLFSYIDAILAASCSQSSRSSWTMQSESIHIYLILSARVTLTASLNVFGNVAIGIEIV